MVAVHVMRKKRVVDASFPFSQPKFGHLDAYGIVAIRLVYELIAISFMSKVPEF